MSEIENNLEQAYKMGQEQIQNFKVSGVPVIVSPSHSNVKIMKELFDEMSERPHRIRQRVRVQSVDSFIEYFNRYSDDNSTVFIDYDNAVFIGVMDYHETTESPRHCDHIAVYECPKTNEWNSWYKNNNEKMNQDDFAIFIEDNLNEISDPNGSEMLEIAQTLKATSSVDFRSSKMLDNGQTQFQYHETINGSAGQAGQLEIPNLITLQIPLFQHGAAYEIQARFRYRINSGNLVFWYTLIRPHLSVNDAVNEVVETVKDKIERGHVYLGTR